MGKWTLPPEGGHMDKPHKIYFQTMTKHDVEERGREGRLFPPKTTKHVITVELPEHHTPLADLLAPEAPPSHGGAHPHAHATGGRSG